MKNSLYDLFPGLEKKPWVYFNLNDEFLNGYDVDPKTISGQQSLIPANVYSYGGFGERRTAVWEGFEPDAKEMIHLGIDFNGLPKGQQVTSISDGVVVLACHDAVSFNGWGGRVIVKHQDTYYLYGHMYHPLVKKGDEIQKGTIIGKLADPANNGGWFVHLHLQIMTEEYVKKFASLEDVDGYDFERMPDGLLDPMKFFKIENFFEVGKEYNKMSNNTIEIQGLDAFVEENIVIDFTNGETLTISPQAVTHCTYFRQCRNGNRIELPAVEKTSQEVEKKEKLDKPESKAFMQSDPEVVKYIVQYLEHYKNNTPKRVPEESLKTDKIEDTFDKWDCDFIKSIPPGLFMSFLDHIYFLHIHFPLQPSEETKEVKQETKNPLEPPARIPDTPLQQLASAYFATVLRNSDWDLLGKMCNITQFRDFTEEEEKQMREKYPEWFSWCLTNKDDD